MKILITGGAGFVGSHLALAFRNQRPTSSITVFDNLHRRGSEDNLSVFKRHNIKFIHGDIRCSGDLESISDQFDVFIEASAEPSVLAGMDGSPRYVIDTNLSGTV